MNNTASAAMRLLAWFIDLLIIFVVYLLIVLFVVSSGDLTVLLDHLLITLIATFIIFPILLPLFQILLISRYKGTLGKLISGLEIVDSESGNSLSFARAFYRNYVGYIASGSLFFLGFIWILKNRERRGWHDLLADSKVIRKNQMGLATGLFGGIILTAINIYLAISIVSQISLNKNIYQSVFQEAREEMQKSKIKDVKPTRTPMIPNLNQKEFNIN